MILHLVFHTSVGLSKVKSDTYTQKEIVEDSEKSKHKININYILADYSNEKETVTVPRNQRLFHNIYVLTQHLRSVIYVMHLMRMIP